MSGCRDMCEILNGSNDYFSNKVGMDFTIFDNNQLSKSVYEIGVRPPGNGTAYQSNVSEHAIPFLNLYIRLSTDNCRDIY